MDFFFQLPWLIIPWTPPPAHNPPQTPRSPNPCRQHTPGEDPWSHMDLNHHSTCPAGNVHLPLPVVCCFSLKIGRAAHPGQGRDASAASLLPHSLPRPCSAAQLLLHKQHFPFVSPKLQTIFFFQANSLLRQDCFEVPAHPPERSESLPAWYHLQL